MNVSELEQFDLHCPFCFGKILRAKHASETPYSGDFAFCGACGNVGVFSHRTSARWVWRVRKPTAAERKAISQHPTVNALRIQWAGKLH